MTLQFQENIIIDSPQNLMEVRHLVLQGSNYEIGKKLGEIAIERHHIQKTPSVDPLITRCRRLYFQKNYPIHLERMRGVADAYGMSLEDDSIDFGRIIYYLDFARTYLDLPRCSNIFYPPQTTSSGHGVLSRNMDFRAHESPEPYIMEVYPEEGYPSLYLCSFDLLGCMDGINSEGLVVALNADDESMDKYPLEPTKSGAVGISEILILRLLLDTCATVDEAKEALLINKQYYSAIPSHYIIGDRSGDSFVWEYSHAHNKEYIINGGGKPQIMTNHPLHRYQSMEYFPGEDETRLDTYQRYKTLLNALKGHPGKFTLDFIKKTNASVFATYPQSNSRTLWHSIYTPENRSLEIDFYLRDEPNPDQPDQKKIVRSGYYQFPLDY